MAEQSGFFNSNIVNGEYDRVYLAESFAKYFASFIGNGIFGGKLSELMVTQAVSTGMKIEVLPGMGWINGYWYENSSNLSFDIEAPDGVLNRIDSVILQWNKLSRSINVVIKKGTPATTPTISFLQRDENVYELKLAEVYVKAGATNIVQADIKDLRADTSVCGFVKGLIEQIDTTEFSEKLNYFLKELELRSKDEINGIIDRLNALVEDENILGNLTIKVDDVISKVALLKQTLGYTKKNLALYPYVETSKVEYGITWTDNGDGTITANGTAVQQAHFLLQQTISLKPGKYIVSAGMETSTKTYFIYVEKTVKPGSSAEPNILYGSYQNGGVFEITEWDVENYNFYFSLIVASGVTVSNLTFKPMLRRAEITDSTWEPYKLSVNETIQEDEVEKGCFYRMNRLTGVKEWINPPLKYGVEYCMTERWENKPVYQKTFYLSVLPDKNVASLQTGTIWDKVVSIDAYALDSDDLTYYPFPVILQNQITPVAVINKIESDGSLAITTNIDASHLKAYVTVKYTK